MFPEVDRALAWGVMASVAAGLFVVGLGFRAADLAVAAGSWALGKARSALAPSCPDCLGKGWRRWRDADRASVAGWTNCRLCRGLGRIVDEGATS